MKSRAQFVISQFTKFTSCAILLLHCGLVASLELFSSDNKSATGELKFLGGLQYGTGLNFGYGAIDSPSEKSRATLSLAVKPRLDLVWQMENSEFYSTLSMVAATTTLDGELSGQIVRSGDQAVDSDSTKIGWRNELIDLSYGGQEFTIGDGFVVGDGNFNKGTADGQYWIGAFTAWRNSAIIRIDTSPLRFDGFWLRTDDDLGDARVVGVNLETAENELGTLGLMYFEIIQDDDFALDGMRVASIRGADIRVPFLQDLKLFGEYVIERGRSKETGFKNNGDGWYIEGNYAFSSWPWKPTFIYRYAHFSGDDTTTDQNEEYRGLFFTIFKRDWDTWYQGEVAGEFHLFNQNQVTQMAKMKVYPGQNWSLGIWYYSHDLDTKQYFGKAVSDLDWAEEINLGYEYFPSKQVYFYAGYAWGMPHQAARDAFQHNRDTHVFQTFISYTFR